MSTAPRGVVPFPIQETLLPELRQAQNRYALLTLLEPLVEEQIVRPKMQALQRTWDVDTLPVLNAELHAIGDKVSTWRARLPEARDGWDAVSVALSAMAEGAAAWTAQPPSQPFWWASPESESRLVLGLGSHREALSQPPSLAHLAVQQQELRNHLAEVAGTWQRRWQDIPLESSSSSGWSASWFSKAMPWVPAALGLLLVTLVWGHTSASRQVIAAVDRAIAYGSPPALADWCGAQISSRYTPSNPSPRLGRQFLVQTVAALLWMGMVAHQTLGQPDADWTPWVPTAIAAGLLLAVAGYRFFSLKQGLRHFETDLQADDDSNSPAVASLNDAPEHAEENPVEISLRR